MALEASKEKAITLVGREIANLAKYEYYDLNKLNVSDVREIRRIYLSLARFLEDHSEGDIEPYVLMSHIEAILEVADARQVGRYYPKGMKDEVFTRDGHKCLRCGATDNLTIDHITPLSVGGVTEVDNLQVLCARCNLLKRVETKDWRVKVG